MNPDQFEEYQLFTEKTIYNLSQQVTLLENKLNMFTNLLEISKYINQYIKDPNLFPLINDMLIGVFGTKYSTIYIKIENFYDVVAQTVTYSFIEEEKKLILDHHEEEFVINSKKPIYEGQTGEDLIYSCLGVPIKVDGRLLGFILIQHTEKSYFTNDHAVFLSSIGNHIGVAIENNILYKQIKDSAHRDGLTDIFNKRYFFETLNINPNLSEQDYSIAMIDLDNFKYINDTYGHPNGDIVLKKVAEVIKKATRNSDIVARYGGDEIIIFFNNFIDAEKIKNRVEVMRQEIEQIEFDNDGVSFKVTVSIGVYCKNNENLTLDEVIKKADNILYLSKKNGRNKVTMN